MRVTENSRSAPVCAGLRRFAPVCAGLRRFAPVCAGPRRSIKNYFLAMIKFTVKQHYFVNFLLPNSVKIDELVLFSVKKMFSTRFLHKSDSRRYFGLFVVLDVYSHPLFCFCIMPKERKHYQRKSLGSTRVDLSVKKKKQFLRKIITFGESYKKVSADFKKQTGKWLPRSTFNTWKKTGYSS